MFDVAPIPPTSAICEIITTGSPTTYHCELTVEVKDGIVVVDFNSEPARITFSGPPYESGMDILFVESSAKEASPAAGRCDVFRGQRYVSCRMNVGDQFYIKAKW